MKIKPGKSRYIFDSATKERAINTLSFIYIKYGHAFLAAGTDQWQADNSPLIFGDEPDTAFIAWLTLLRRLIEYNGKLQDDKASAEARLLLNKWVEETDVMSVQNILTATFMRITGKEYYRRLVVPFIVEGVPVEAVLTRIEHDERFAMHKRRIILFFLFRSLFDTSFLLYGNSRKKAGRAEKQEDIGF